MDDGCREKLNPIPNDSAKIIVRDYPGSELKKNATLFASKLTYYKPFMHLIDVLVSVCVSAPLVVTFWRGTWGLIDVYGKVFPTWEAFLFTSAILMCFNLLRELFADILNCFGDEKKTTLAQKFGRRVYTYAFAVVSILQWRSLWAMFDWFFQIKFAENGLASQESNLLGVYICTGCCFLAVVALKSTRNMLAPPFVITLDKEEFTFEFPTRFRIRVSFSFLTFPLFF